MFKKYEINLNVRQISGDIKNENINIKLKIPARFKNYSII